MICSVHYDPERKEGVVSIFNKETRMIFRERFKGSVQLNSSALERNIKLLNRGCLPPKIEILCDDFGIAAYFLLLNLSNVQLVIRTDFLK